MVMPRIKGCFHRKRQKGASFFFAGNSCESSGWLERGKGSWVCHPLPASSMGDPFPSPGWVPRCGAGCWCKSGAARLAGVNLRTNLGWIMQILAGWRSKGCASPSLPSYSYFGNPGLPGESLSGLILRHTTPGGRGKEKGNNFLQLLEEFSCL